MLHKPYCYLILFTMAFPFQPATLSFLVWQPGDVLYTVELTQIMDFLVIKLYLIIYFRHWAYCSVKT